MRGEYGERICCDNAVAELRDDGSIVCSECWEPVDLLPGAVINAKWMKAEIGTPTPKEYDEGLWGLNAAVRAAVRGGWTDDDVRKEVDQLLVSYRQPPTE